MTIVVLIVTFFTSTGDSLYMDGWHPRQQPSMDICLERSINIENYLDQLDFPKHIESFTVECKEIS